MKKIITALSIFGCTFAFSQVGIGTSTPNGKSILDLTATDKGFLLPRMTAVQRIATAPNVTTDLGLQVYDTTTASVWYWNGTACVKNGGINIYKSDGFLSSNRTVGQGSNTLTFTGSTRTDFNNAGISFPGNTRQGVAKIFDATIGDMYGMEQVSGSQSGIESELRFFSSNNSITAITFGKYTSPTAYTENMRIMSTGNIGVGTIAPTGRLHVSYGAGDTRDLLISQVNKCGGACGQGTARNIVLANTNETNSLFASIDFVPSSTSSNPSGAAISGSDRDATNHYAGLAFFTRNATNYDARLVIRSSGYVGIGILNPLYPFHMASGANVTNAGVWTNASDARLKANVVNSNYGLKEILSLPPVQYIMKSDSSKQVGFIAQEVKRIIPEVVSGTEGDIEKGETLGFAYGNLAAVLTKAIQE